MNYCILLHTRRQQGRGVLSVQVIPKAGGQVKVVLGADTGRTGTVVEIHKQDFKVEVELSNSGEHVFKEYEHVCKLAG
jgi:transcription antitermination factor NusG